MKKILTIITSIALLASLPSLTACSNAESMPTGSNSEPVSQTSETSPDNNSQSPNNSENSETSSDNASQNFDNSVPETNSRPVLSGSDLRSTSEGFAEKLALFDLSDIELPNGEVIKNSDADFVHSRGDMVTHIGFDSVYMYKAKPYYRNTIDEPDIISWETLELKNDPGEFTDYEYFKVKAGDTLDNGLTVKSAEFWYGRILNEYYVDLSFDGELTLEGILYRTPEDEYGANKGDLHFFPDTTKKDFFSPFELYRATPQLFVDNVNKLAVNYTSGDIHLGNDSDASSEVLEILGDGAFAKVKVTVTDLHFLSNTLGVIPRAVIKSIVKL